MVVPSVVMLLFRMIFLATMGCMYPFECAYACVCMCVYFHMKLKAV